MGSIGVCVGVQAGAWLRLTLIESPNRTLYSLFNWSSWVRLAANLFRRLQRCDRNPPEFFLGIKMEILSFIWESSFSWSASVFYFRAWILDSLGRQHHYYLWTPPFLCVVRYETKAVTAFFKCGTENLLQCTARFRCSPIFRDAGIRGREREERSREKFSRPFSWRKRLRRQA